MKHTKLTHINAKGDPAMVDISAKAVTKRIAKARAIVHVGETIIKALQEQSFATKKGPVFQTAILAGIMGAKKTSDLIPLCHPLGLDDCQVEIAINGDEIEIVTTATVTGKTGVEMEALTAASVAALTIYDMCKAMSHTMVIKEIRLLEKTGGKKDFIYEESR
ncbi:MAG TPA: cyclic pyranopterin monophosphate synthase MoaC [Chryseosolibacter sp.]